MTTQSPATAEIERLLRFLVRFFTIFWLRLRILVQRKNAEHWRNWLRLFGSMASTAVPHPRGVRSLFFVESESNPAWFFDVCCVKQQCLVWCQISTTSYSP